MIREYDFTEFTSKDFFEMRLAGIQPDFRYIGASKRARFVAFCVDHGFIKYRDKDVQDKAVFYTIEVPFRYQAMFNYDIRPVIAPEDSMLLVYTDGNIVISHGKI